MWEGLHRFWREQKRLRVASCIFVVASLILYITNLLIHIFTYRDSVWLVIGDFLSPLLLGISVYLTGWLHEGTEKLLREARGNSLLAIFAPAVATFFSFLTYWPDFDWVDFGITVFAVLSMGVTSYALKDLQKAFAAILAQTVWFVFLAAYLGNNAAAMVTIPLAAVVLILQMPKQRWQWQFEKGKKMKITLALLSLLFILIALVRIENTGVLNAFLMASRGRPGLGSSATVNRGCAAVLQTAKLVGSIPLQYPTGGIFENRALTIILADAGWLAAIPVLLAIVAMFGSGIYICAKHKTFRSCCSAVFLTVMALQTAGYLLMCAGWDELLFPEMCPFLDGGSCYNSLFILMAVWVLPSVEHLLPGLLEYYEEDSEEESQDDCETEEDEYEDAMDSEKEEGPEDEERIRQSVLYSLLSDLK